MSTETTNSIKISLTASKILSAGIINTGVSPISSVTIEGLCDSHAHNILLNIYGLSKSGFFIERTRIPMGEVYLSEKSSDGNEKLVVLVSDIPLKMKSECLCSIKSTIVGKIYAEAIIDGKKYLADSPVTLYPLDVYPKSASPIVFASMLSPDDSQVERIAQGCHSPEELYLSVRNENIIYSVKDCDFLSRDTAFDSPETIFSRRSKMASPFEMAILYCSAAVSCGETPIVVASRTGKGPRIFCGSIKHGSVETPLLTSVKKLRSLLAEGKVLLFDISCLFTGHNVEFEDACKNAEIELSSLDIVFALDILGALKKEISFASSGEKNSAIIEKLRKKESKRIRSLSDYAEELCDTSDNPLLSFVPDTSSTVPVCLSDMTVPGMLAKTNGELFISALSDKIEDEMLFRLGYLSMLGRSAEAELTLGEKQKTADGKKALASYLLSEEKKGALSVYGTGKKVYRTLLEMTRKQKGENIYLVCGFLHSRNGYAPIALYPLNIKCENDSCRISFTSPKPYVNRLLAETLAESAGTRAFFEKYGSLSGTLSDILHFYGKLCAEKREFSIVGECFIAHLPYKESILSFDIVDKFDRIIKDKLTSGILSPGTYKTAEYDKGSYSARIRELETASSGIFSGEIYEACAAIRDQDVVLESGDPALLYDAAIELSLEELKSQNSTLIVSDSKKTAEGLKEAFGELGFSDPVLVISSEKRLSQVLSDKLLALSQAALPEISDFDDAEYYALRDKLYLYENCKTRRYDFDFSFSEAADAFADAGVGLSDEEKEIILEPENLYLPDMGKESVRELFDAQMMLSKAASRIGTVEPFSQHPLFGIGLSDDSLDTNKIVEMIKECRTALDEFLPECISMVEKTGFDGGSIKNLPALYAYLSLVLLVSKEYKEDMTSGLLTCDIYAISKNIPSLCELSEKLISLSGELSEYSELVFAISAKELEEALSDSTKKNDMISRLSALKKDGSVSKKEAFDILAVLSEYETTKAEFDSLAENMEECFGDVFCGTDTDWTKIKEYVSFAKMADVLLKKIHGTDSELRRLSALCFSSISEFCKDKKNTSTVMNCAGLFDRMFSDDGSFIELSKLVCADIYNMTFPSGILSQEGISALLTGWNDNAEMLPVFAEYNKQSKRCEKLGLSCFVKYYADNGYSHSTGRIFTRSLLGLAMKQIKLSDRNFVTYADYEEDVERFLILHGQKTENNRKKLLYGYYKSCASFINSAPDRTSAFSESLSDPAFSAQDILLRYGEMIKALFPIIICEPYFARHLSGFGNIIFTGAERIATSGVLSLLNAGEHKLILSTKHPEDHDCFATDCEKAGVLKLSCTSLGTNTDGRLSALVGQGECYAISDGAPSLSYIMTPVSSYDKEKEINVLEAQTIGLEIMKLCEKSGRADIGVITFTVPQSRIVENVLSAVSEKSEAVRLAIFEGRIEVSSDILSKKRDMLFVSTVYGKDEGLSLTPAASALDDRNNTVVGVPECIYRALSYAKSGLLIVSSLSKGEYPERAGSYALSRLFGLVEFASAGGRFVMPRFGKYASGYAMTLCEIASKNSYSSRLVLGGYAAEITVGEKDYIFLPERSNTAAVFDSEARLASLLRKNNKNVIRIDGADIMLNSGKIADKIRTPEEKV